MGNYSTVLLVVIFVIIALTLLVLFLTLLRETLFWYWRSKGVVHQPQDILSRSHDTALIIRKNIDGLKRGEEAKRQVTDLRK